MPISIQPFDASRIGAIVDLNRRLAAAGSSWQIPEHLDPSWFARGPGRPLSHDFLLAVEGEAVRGGYVLLHRRAAFASEERAIANWYMPISEGAIDSRYVHLAIQLLRDAVRREPLCYGLGLEGAHSVLAQMATRLGCELRPIPFFVRIENGQRFAREARYLRQRRGVARLLDIAAATGSARLGAALARLTLQRTRQPGSDTRVQSIFTFGPWADELWTRCRTRYSFAGVRDAATLSQLYPARTRFRAVRVLRAQATVGWAVLDAKQMSDDSRFGDLRMGRIVDCFSAPEDAELVIRAAVDVLVRERVDVILSNQSHPAWCAALRRNAFLSAPSSFVFAPSPELGKKIRAIDPDGRQVHLTRGDDGNGPLMRAPFSARRVRSVHAAYA